MINIRIILFLLTATLGIFLLLRFQGNLQTGKSPMGILSLEFAHKPACITEITHAWSSEGMMGRARANIWIDFLFIPFYAMLFYTLCGSISVRMKDFPAKLGIFLAFGALIAGLLDVLENILMLFSLNGNYNGVTAFLTAFFATGKFVLLLLAALYVVPLGLRLIILKLIPAKQQATPEGAKQEGL
jgi:hypothetical protein